MSVFGPLSTTLNTTGGIDARQTRFTLTSTSGISGVGSVTTSQSVLVIDGEKMLVQSVPLSTVVEVIRGVDGTAAKPHANAANVWFAAKSAFGPANPDGFVTLNGTGGTPDGILPQYPMTLGSRRQENGKEYILCDFLQTVHTGMVVLISNDGNFTTGTVLANGNGPVGVVAEQTSTSDYWGWVQVYGATNAQDASATSAATSAYMPIAAGSVSSPATGLSAVAATSTAQQYIFNMFITGIATTLVGAGTPAAGTSHTGVQVPVFLNYPYINSNAVDPAFS